LTSIRRSAGYSDPSSIEARPPTASGCAARCRSRASTRSTASSESTSRACPAVIFYSKHRGEQQTCSGAANRSAATMTAFVSLRKICGKSSTPILSLTACVAFCARPLRVRRSGALTRSAAWSDARSSVSGRCVPNTAGVVASDAAPGIPAADGERRVLVAHCPRVGIERTEFGVGTLSLTG
jgi:hypothetical protein